MPRKKQVKPVATKDDAPSSADVDARTFNSPANVEQEMYDLYVQGKRINDIAEGYGVESLKVVEAIKKIEASR